MHLFLDLETYSPEKIKNGTARYAAHPETDVICGGFDLVDKNRKSIYLMPLYSSTLSNEGLLEGFLKSFKEVLKEAELIIAHNIEFDYEIFVRILQNKYCFPEIDASKKLVCTRKRQSFYNQPASLKEAANFYKTETRKIAEGKDLIKQLSYPQPDGNRLRNDYLEKQMLDYCLQDIETLKCLFFSQQDFAKIFYIQNNDYKAQALDLEINRTGIPVNTQLAEKLVVVGDEQKAIAQLEFCKKFNNFNLPSLTQTAALKDFIKNQFNYELASFSDSYDKVPANVREVLELRDLATKTSFKKAESVLECQVDGRLFNLFYYYGGHTGRWSGRNFQPQNLPRGAGDTDLVAYLRNVVATGKDSSLVWLDYKGIEHRAAYYMAVKFMEAYGVDCNNTKGHYDLFFTNADSYLTFAAEIYNVPLSSLTEKSPEREVGKVAHLGLTYGMGKVKFADYLTNFKINLAKYDKEGRCLYTHAQESARVVKLYRDKYTIIPEMWAFFQNSVVKCLENAVDCEVELFWNMKIRYVQKLPFSDSNCLAIFLPNGRPLFYYDLRLSQDNYGNMKSIIVGQDFFHGGKFLENVIQALCRDLTAEHMLALFPELRHAKIIMHVHDEIVVESLDAYLEYNTEIMRVICKKPPHWLAGFPLGYDFKTSKYYKK